MGQVGKTQLCEASAIRSCFLVTSQVGARGEGAASEVTICDTGQQVKEGRHSLSHSSSRQMGDTNYTRLKKSLMSHAHPLDVILLLGVKRPPG